MEQMPTLKTPNSPEHVEVVKTDIQDEGNKISFIFRFARPVTRDEIDEMWDDSGRTIQTTVMDTLNAKGWKPTDSVEGDARPATEDGKTWEYWYVRTEPGAPSSVN